MKPEPQVIDAFDHIKSAKRLVESLFLALHAVTHEDEREPLMYLANMALENVELAYSELEEIVEPPAKPELAAAA